ncbi:hypothetical protein [Nocardia wallacei]|nr:hypothetical protein [Nocardia wallacei]
MKIECEAVLADLLLLRGSGYSLLELSRNEKAIKPVLTRSGYHWGQGYAALLADLPDSTCRWALYNFRDESPDGRTCRFCLITWLPAGASDKTKVAYYFDKDALITTVEEKLLSSRVRGLAVMEATSYADMAYETVLAEVNRQFDN